MNPRLLWFLDGTLWCVNAVMWTFYAKAPAMGVMTACAALLCFYVWRAQWD